MSAATATIQRPNPTPPWPPEARGGLLYTLAVAAHRAGRKVVAGVPVIAAGTLFWGFNPAVSVAALKAMRATIRELDLRHRTQLSLGEIARHSGFGLKPQTPTPKSAQLAPRAGARGLHK
jgi:hypothetical protein